MENSLNKKYILIVEDERIVAEDIKQHLQNKGFIVQAIVASGEDALKEIEEHRPDLIIADVVIKGSMTGIEVAEIINTKYKIPVVFLTAYTDDHTLDLAKISEPFGYIVKPFKEQELNSIIKIALYKNDIEQKLRKNEKWLSTVLKNINSGIITTDNNSVVNFINPVALQLINLKLNDVIGREIRNLVQIVDFETGANLNFMFEKSFDDKYVCKRFHNCLLIKKKGAPLPVEFNLAPIIDDYKNVVGSVIAIRDVTERIQAEKRLKESEENYRTIIENISDAVFITDDDGIFTFICANIDKIFGFNSNEVERFGNVNQLLGKRLFTKSNLERHGEINNLDCIIIDKFGGKKNILINVRKVNIKGGTRLYTCRDITERKKLEGQILEICEKEQRRIGQDIHDGLGQYLTGIAFKMQALRDKMGNNSESEVEIIDDIILRMNGAIAKTRCLAKGLYPIIENRGFLNAIKDLTSNIENIFKISCIFRYDQNIKINSKFVGIHLYRIAQEAINNSIKHGKASKIYVELKRKNETIVFSIRDNGIGTPEMISENHGLGLMFMKYRADMIQANFDISFEKNGGTIVTCKFLKSEGTENVNIEPKGESIHR